jgi:hypothetical protein
MAITSSWQEISRAAASFPTGCFDGYFGQGISDTIIRKMRADWPGFLELLAAQPRNKKLFSLVLNSINATLNPDDILAVNHLALNSCTSKLRKDCNAISRRAKAALADYDPPISPAAP